MRNKYFVWYIAALMPLVGLFIDLAGDNRDAWLPVSLICGGIISFVLFVVGIIYYQLRKRPTTSRFSSITVDACVCYTILYPALIMFLLALSSLFHYPFKTLFELITFPDGIGIGLYLFGLVQIIALVTLIANTNIRSD